MQMHHLFPTFKKVTEEVEYLAKEIRELGTRYAKSLRKIKELKEPPTKRRMTIADNMFKDLEMKKLRIRGLQRKRYAIEQQMLRDVVADADVVRYFSHVPTSHLHKYQFLSDLHDMYHSC
jgi:hypothetical protein